MKCSGCGFDNPPGMRFCGQCGSGLPTVCLRCETENPPGHNFCGKCGARLTDQSAAPHVEPDPPLERSIEPEGERRHMTVMFCDLIGSTALSEALDPEDLRDLFGMFQEIADRAVKHYDGSIAKFLGDGILVYFGYPLAHEDDAVRAVKASLELIDGLSELNVRLAKQWAAGRNIKVEARVGIHTGLVVVGDMRTQSFHERDAIVGQTPNVAARIQSVAKPNRIVVSADTYRLLRTQFECVSLGERRLKGLSKPVVIFEVEREHKPATGDEPASGQSLIPLVGRTKEVDTLIDRWQLASAGAGQAVAIGGEAGIGKSRLIQSLRDRLRDEPHSRLRCQSSPYFSDTAFYPIKELLARVLQFERDDPAEVKGEKLQVLLERYELDNELPAMTRFLAIGGKAVEGRSAASPEMQRKELLRVLTELILGLAKEQPLLILFEDLHWLDASSFEFIQQLISAIASSPVLIVMTFRPEFEAKWREQPHLGRIDLHRLSAQDADALVLELTGGRTLPREVMREIIEKTDGVPLFIEELTKMVLESPRIEARSDRFVMSGESLSLDIPETLQESLRARLDRLAVDKTITQIGAAIGRSFSYELMAALAPMDSEQLVRELDKLVDAEVFHQRGKPPHAEYVFKHALIQDTAYQSLLKSTRQKVHQRIAQVLQEMFPDIAELQPEVMAKHFTEAGAYREAIIHWQRAGQHALTQSAHVEAVSHFKRGIDLVRALDESPDRLKTELILQALLGNSLMSTRGYGSAEVERAYKRAWQLCQKAGAAPQLLNVQFGLWGFYLLRGEIDSATKLALECQRQAASIHAGYIAEQVCFVLGQTHYWSGELIQAQEYLERGIQEFDEAYRRSRALPAVQDPAVGSRSILAMARWLRGERQSAFDAAEQALALADKLSHPFSAAFALGFGALLYQLEGDVNRTLDLARKGIALSAEQGFSFYLALCVTLEGWAIGELGDRRHGIARMEEGIDGYLECGANLGRPYLVALLGMAYLEFGDIDKGRTAIEEAERDMIAGGGRYYHAEVYRMKAVAAAKFSALEDWGAENLLRKSLKIAQHQGGDAIRLRSAIQLAELLSKDGRHNEGRQELEAALGSFPNADSNNKHLELAREWVNSIAR